MLLKAPAKINLTLKVHSKRADGYHEIESVMRGLQLFDELVIVSAGKQSFSHSDAGETKIRVMADMPGVPEGPTNLAYKAAELALAEWGDNRTLQTYFPESIDIKLKKNIPMAAGLAGGSADAAAVLLGLAKEFAVANRENIAPTLPEIAALGTKLGADVPFCVYACAAANPELGYEGAAAVMAEGIGERLTPMPNTENAYVILVKPPIEVSAAEVYTMFDEMGCRDATKDAATRNGRFASDSDNDLERPCAEAYPVVAQILESLKKICAEEGLEKIKVQLSGSGPTVFVYITEDADAGMVVEHIYNRINIEFSDMFVHLTRTL